ncbi:hypothetical protein A8F02_29815, partial [Burkholderia cenocepacia]
NPLAPVQGVVNQVVGTLSGAAGNSPIAPITNLVSGLTGGGNPAGALTGALGSVTGALGSGPAALGQAAGALSG